MSAAVDPGTAESEPQWGELANPENIQCGEQPTATDAQIPNQFNPNYQRERLEIDEGAETCAD